MKEEIIKEIDPSLENLNVHISDVYVENDEGVDNLNIEVDSDEIIDVEKITEVSRIINKKIDTMNIPLEGYILDVHSKEKGE